MFIKILNYTHIIRIKNRHNLTRAAERRKTTFFFNFLVYFGRAEKILFKMEALLS